MSIGEIALKSMEAATGTGKPDRVWFDTKQVSDYTGIPCRTIQYMRQTGRGPKYSAASRRRPLYHIDHINEWLASQTVMSTAEARRLPSPSTDKTANIADNP